MKIDVATAEDVRSVALRMRERDFDEFRATSAAESREQLADALAATYGGRDDVLAVYHDGSPVCIGGTIEAWPNVISLLFFATDDFPKVAVPVTRFIRKLFNRYEQAGAHRIQAISLDGHSYAHQWLGILGLKPETGPMVGYGKNGEAFIQFARVSDVRSARA